MPGNTTAPTDTSPPETPSNKVAGVLSFLAAISISFAAVVIGEGLTYNQYQESVLGSGLWPVSAALAIAFAVVAGLFTMMVGLGIISAINTPKFRGRTEYTIIGAGGVFGTIMAILVSTGVLITGSPLLGSILPNGSGESAIALGAVAAPLGYVFYELYKPDMTPVGVRNSDAEQLDPEVVRDKTESWSDRAAASPAQRQPSNHQESQGNAQQPQPDRPASNEAEATDPSDSSEARSSADFEDMEYRWNAATDVSFDNVGGMHDLKEELQRDVIGPLTTHREKAEELGVSAPNIIFHGPPGTGKTYIAKALATELGLPFAQLSGADIQSKWINESATKVQTLFQEAERVAAQEGGAVVFLDELDTVLKNRDSGGSAHEEDNKVVNEFLNHLEDTEDHNIVFIGATNRLDSLDDAGIRSGRIDKKVHVGKPDADARAAVLKAQLDGRPHSLTDKEINRAAAQMDGVVAADIELVVKNAAKHVLVRDGDSISWEDLQTAIDQAT